MKLPPVHTRQRHDRRELPADTTVGTLTAIDPDDGDTHSFRLTDPAQHPDNVYFTIDGDQLKASASFDFETKASYTLNLQVTDAGGLTFAQEVTINVTDVVEQEIPVNAEHGHDDFEVTEKDLAKWGSKSWVEGKGGFLLEDGVIKYLTDPSSQENDGLIQWDWVKQDAS